MEDISGFNPWITAKVYSVHENWVRLANAINLLGSNKLSPRAIYDFYYYTVPRNKRWLPYPKTAKDPIQVQYVMEWFGVNEMVAKDYIDLLDKKELKKITDAFEKRGVRK